MTHTGSQPAPPQNGLSGWIEALLFTMALGVLNISYALGHQIGVHAAAFLAWAMPVAALCLLAYTGPGPDWRPIVMHPLSLVVGGCIIAMEAAYYVLLRYLTPADGSLIVRLSVPVGAVMAFLLLRRRPSRLGLVGVAVVTAGILGYVPMIAPEHRMIGLLIGLGCASIMSTRAFAMELHPWNRQARTVVEKMRVTGLMLLVTSLMGLALLFSLMAMIEGGLMPPLAAIPTPRQLLHPPAIALGLFMGALVLTVMQYLGFSVVVKIRAENFLATTAMIPLVTIVFQLAAIALGILSPIPVDWGVLPAMGVVVIGMLIVIWAGRRPVIVAAPQGKPHASE